MSADDFKKYRIDYEVEADLDKKAECSDTEPGVPESSEESGKENQEEKEKKEEKIKTLEGEELDILGKEIGISRKNGESDTDFRGRMAMEEVDGDLEKCLEATLAKRRADWHRDEVYLHKVFKSSTVVERKKFIKDYLNREEYSEEIRKIADRYYVKFPEPCVLNNELREIMVWFLGTVAPWERDPCLGCSYCLLGKHPDENSSS